MVDAITDTLVQGAIFICLPLICYLIFVKEKAGFFRWVGLSGRVVHIGIDSRISAVQPE